jgi:siroheme synthase-like protein
MPVPIYLPISVNIAGKKILLIGGGKVALHKASLLLRFTNELTVVSPAFCTGFEALPIVLIKKTYDPADLYGAFLAYICTENEQLNATIKAECEKRGIPANVCDNPHLCDFISPAIYKKDCLTIAVSTGARNVRRSIAIRDRIKALAETEILKIYDDTLSTDQ